VCSEAPGLFPFLSAAGPMGSPEDCGILINFIVLFLSLRDSESSVAKIKGARMTEASSLFLIVNLFIFLFACPVEALSHFMLRFGLLFHLQALFVDELLLGFCFSIHTSICGSLSVWRHLIIAHQPGIYNWFDHKIELGFWVWPFY